MNKTNELISKSQISTALMNIRLLKSKKSESLSSLFLILIFLHSVLFVSSCNSQELTRAKAQKMITESKDFGKPKVLELNQLYIKDGDGVTEAKSDDEPESEAAQRRIQEYLFEVPAVAVANHLGLVKPELKRKNDKPDYPSTLRGYWHFDEKYLLTDKGRKMWEDMNLPVTESMLPLARPVFLEITGITKQGETNQLVEFKWKWEASEIGKSLDQTTEEFKRLPENLRKNLTDPDAYSAQDGLKSWGGERTGKAMFQKYDDGWRLISLGVL